MLIRLSLILKVVAFLLGCLCTAVLAFALYVWLTLDPAKLEAELARQLAEQSQRALRIDGGLRIALWPRPALRLDGATLSEIGSDRRFAEIGPTRFELALRPLLTREVVIERIDSQGGSYRLTRRRDGKWDGADLAETLDGLIGAEGPTRLALRGFSLRQGSVQLRDEASGRGLRLESIVLRVSEIDAAHGGPLAFSAHVTGSEPAIDMTVQLNGMMGPAAEEGAWSLLNPRASFVGRFADLSEARGQFGAIRFDLTWGSGWSIEKLTSTLNGKQDGRPVEMALDVPRLEWRDGSPRAASAEASIGFGTSTAAKGQAGSVLRVALSELAPAKGGFGGRLEARWQTEGKADAARDSLTMRTAVRFEDERALWRFDDITGTLKLGAPWLRESARDLRLGGGASWRVGAPAKGEDERPGRLSLELSAGQNALRAEGRLSGWLPLTGQLDLEAKRLDGDALLDTDFAQSIELPLHALQYHALEGRVRIDQLRLAGLDFNDLFASYVWGRGRVELGELRLGQGGAKALGKLGYDVATGALAGQFKLDKLDTRALAAHAGLTLPLSGRADGTLDLSAKGGDNLALRDSLSQQWQLRYALPVLEGIDLARSVRELREPWLAQKTATRTCEADERTELASLSLSARVTQRQLDIERLDANASWVTLSGTGRAEFGTDSLALRTRTTPTNPAIRSFARDLADLKGIALPLVIGHNRGKTSVSLTLQKQP